VQGAARRSTLSRTKFILIGVVASSLSLLLFVAGLHHSASTPSSREPMWTVKSSLGTFQILIVHVEAQPPADLKRIGRAIVVPVMDKYDEVLIYVRTGKSGLRRIQWTPEHGYVELVISG
jgi:hypothetical protein